MATLSYKERGLRVSEACDLRWDDIDLAARTIVIRRLKGSRDSTHYLERDELAHEHQLLSPDLGRDFFFVGGA